MDHTDLYLNLTSSTTFVSLLTTNTNLTTTIIDSSSLDDLCKNFHVSFRSLWIQIIVFINLSLLFP
jgi:hypothetical protein